ncbi:N(5)-(carboxyethyl)ornithine synthase [Nocardioides sp. STR2]|uniref:N(5)-(Carboxyethyl)ornithine synthase n=1 Tax=Nocardioides pini TaxID=2975053 RepID=A0ABT4CEI0_9ACTN|nr:N(5)-(carboxyethyl)ornithine synthase [Nocardioides pini]MCY4727388.1 N(5)-(carboxyethyl)ornithine synthase [Nocardioides pini]
MTVLGLGVIGTSAKENEHRLPLHPEHLSRLAPDVASRTTLEHGYADRFGLSDDDLAPHVAGFASREEILRDSDVVLLPKPQHEDVAAMRAGQVLWGWPHCVQDPVITELAIERELTLIAFEAMNHWTADGHVGLHVFHKNNELAGYCSVLQAMELVGVTGDYGRRLSAVVIGFGATARGAVTALNAHGVSDVAVLTTRGVAAVGSPIHSVRIRQFDHDPDDPGASQVITDEGRVPLAPYLAKHDIVVNCTLQDTAAPLTYLRTEDLAGFRTGSLIVDVSCDEGMGFSWAVPTTFDDPMFTVGGRVHYYAVDHSPSYLWNSATWENSEALLPFVDAVLAGPRAWDADETITRATEIRDGRIRNPAILAFQGRAAEHPYRVL